MKRFLCTVLVLLLMLPAGLAQVTAAPENAVTVSTAEELMAALSDESVTAVTLSGDADVEAFLDTALLVINKPLIVNGSLVFAECAVRLEAQIFINGSLLFGGAVFENNGYVRVCGGGLLGSYQSDFQNFGAAYIEPDGLLACDRGGGWTNYGVLVNEGTIRVTSDGGNASLQADSVLVNQGVLDVTSGYFYDYGATVLGDAQAVAGAVSPVE